MSKCVLCGSNGYDCAIDNLGDFICIDCWASGEAQWNVREAKTAAPAQPIIGHCDYSPLDNQGFIDACNGNKK